MKNTLRLIAFACCTLGLFGCPYDSKVPISKPVFPPDNGLVGKWISGENNKEEYTVTIEGNEYKIVEKDLKSGNTANFRGFVSVVKGAKFFNIYENGAENISYSLYKMEYGKGNTIVLKGISDKVKEEFTSSSELKAFIEQNMNESAFYSKEDQLTFRRKN